MIGVAGIAALPAGQVLAADTAAISVDRPINAEDAALMSELRSKGYSPEESQRIRQIMANSRKFTQELGLSKPLATVQFSPNSNALQHRLGIINTNVGNLATLESKNIRDILGTEKVTPENITQVLTTLHTINPEEASKMYG